MRHALRTLSASLCTLIMSASALSQEAAQANVFNADTSHPDLAAAISAFEQVCMPFVLHQTEMDREHDKRHMAKLMQSREFTYTHSRASRHERYLVAPAPTHWWEQNSKPDFTVFNSSSDQVVLSTKTIVSRSRNTAGNLFKGKYVGIVREIQTYSDKTEPRLTVDMTWNYPTQKDPGKQCEISVSQVTMPRNDFTESFIAKDADWIASADTPTTEPVNWFQCVKEGTDDFEFKVSHEDNAIKISMRRSDFYEPELCGGS